MQQLSLQTEDDPQDHIAQGTHTKAPLCSVIINPCTGEVKITLLEPKLYLSRCNIQQLQTALFASLTDCT